MITVDDIPNRCNIIIKVRQKQHIFFRQANFKCHEQTFISHPNVGM